MGAPAKPRLKDAPVTRRTGAAAIAARALSAKHLKFADLVLEGALHGEAYIKAMGAAKNREMAGFHAKRVLDLPRVQAYMAAVQDQAVNKIVLRQEMLTARALKLADGDGGIAISHSIQLEAIQYLDGCLSRNRTIRIEGLNLNMDVDENHVAAMAWAALEAEAKGDLGTDDARHLIESAAMVQQIMHGRTIAADMGDRPPPVAMPQLPAPKANGTSGNGHKVTAHSNGDATFSMEEPRPVRPKWLKTPEQIAEAAKSRREAQIGAAKTRAESMPKRGGKW